MSRRYAFAAVVLWGLLVLPPLRAILEASLASHMLQLALLAMSGALLAPAIGPRDGNGASGFNRFGLTGMLLALMTFLFWLLPITLDRAVDEPLWTAAKFITLPLLLGLPLAKSWSRLPSVVRAVIIANLIPMAVVMGWVYRESPVRLCNNYLLSDQQILGTALWTLAAVAALYFVARGLFARPG